MGLKIITPRSTPIPIADLRLHLKLDATGGSHPDDALILAQADAAADLCQHHTGRAVGAQTVELALDAFPATVAIALHLGPVQSITSLKYIDTAAAEQTLAPSAYTLDDYGIPAYLVPAVDTVWPGTLATVNAVKVRYLVGDAVLRPSIRAAMLLLVGHLYEHREAVSSGTWSELPIGLRALLDVERDYSGAGGI